MTEIGNTATSRPPCSTWLAEGLYPISPKEVPRSLDSANNFARSEATLEMCQRCAGAFGIICILPGPQHPDQDIIPDITPDILTEFKKEMPQEVLMWFDRILRGKTSMITNPRIPRKFDPAQVMRTSFFKFGFPQDGPLASDREMQAAILKEPDRSDPPVIMTPSHDQTRGVSPEVLIDIGYQPPEA